MLRAWIGSVPPRGSGWVRSSKPPINRGFAPTRYREVVLTLSKKTTISVAPDRSRAVGGRVLKERYLRFQRSCRDAIRFAQAQRGSVDVPPHGENPEQRNQRRLRLRHSVKPQLFPGLQLPV